MRRRTRIVLVMVLGLLLQAAAPAAFASCMGSTSVAAKQMQSHTHHPAATPSGKQTHDCCGSGAMRADCAGSDCASGGCLSLTIPVSLPGALVVLHELRAVFPPAFLPAAPPAFRFRPPIA